MASESRPSGNKHFMVPADISDRDIYEAMKDIPGYLDITPGDLKEVFHFAYQHAVERISGAVKARDIMTAEVHTVLQDTHLKEVANLMGRQAHIPRAGAGCGQNGAAHGHEGGSRTVYSYQYLSGGSSRCYLNISGAVSVKDAVGSKCSYSGAAPGDIEILLSSASVGI